MFITGTGKDFSTARPVYGMFVSPDGETWGNMPFTKEQELDEKKFNKFWDIMNFYKNKLEFPEIVELIKQKKCNLSRKDREFVLNYKE